MGRNLALVTSLVALAAGASSCNALFGVDDYTVQPAEGGSVAVGGGGEGGVGTVCLPNEVMSCYDGPDGTLDVGTCTAGTMTCNENGTAISDCENQQLPSLEDCSTAEDEDCDDLTCGQPVWSRSIADDATNMEDQLVNAVAADDDAVVVTGTFRQAMRIGSNLLQGTNSTDGFIAKFDTLGTLVWRVPIDGAGQQVPHGIVMDAAGDIYVAGTFQTELTAGTDTTNNAMGWDAFVVKYDRDGNHVWSRTYGGDGDVRALAMTVSENNRIVVGGQLNQAVSFGMTNLDGGLSPDAFTLVLGTNGVEHWASSHDSQGSGEARSVAVVGNTVFAGGQFEGNIDVGGTNLNSSGAPDGLLVAYDLANGNISGHLQLTGDAATNITGLAALGDDLVVAGHFDSGTIDFGDGTPHAATNSDVFIARYGPTLGSPTWTRTFNGTDFEFLTSVAVDSTGEIAAVGAFNQTLTLDTLSVTTAGSDDMFLAKLDANGTPRFISSFGDAQADQATAVAIVPTRRHIVLAGIFTGAIDLVVASYSAQGTDSVIARLGP